MSNCCKCHLDSDYGMASILVWVLGFTYSYQQIKAQPELVTIRRYKGFANDEISSAYT